MRTHTIYAYLNQKGGAGKSTTAGHFAVWLRSRRVRTVFVDADGQRSATPWMEAIGVPVIAMHDPEQLFEKLSLLAQEYEAVVVDGPGNASEIAKAILMRCDLVVIPNRPSDLDLRSSGTIAQFIRHAREIRGGKPQAGFFLNAAKDKRSVLLREAQEMLSQSDIPLFKTVVFDRACVTDAPGQQSSVFAMRGYGARQAAQDYDRLFKEVVEAV